ncbi:MAG: hypothetical protein FH758_11965 [Firmicutes bacterium]|nr:hypothetical protein [Bacillota bacterium]
MERYNLWTHYPDPVNMKKDKIISKQIQYRSVPRIGEKVVLQSEVFAVTDIIHEIDENRIIIKLEFTNW